MGDEDLGYVFETWGRSVRPYYRDVHAADFVDGLRQHMRVVLGPYGRRRTALIAHPPEAPGVIVGWAIGEPPYSVDYVYTRAEYRRSHVARRLLEGGKWDLETLESTARLSPLAAAIARVHRIRIRPVF